MVSFCVSYLSSFESVPSQNFSIITTIPMELNDQTLKSGSEVTTFIVGLNASISQGQSVKKKRNLQKIHWPG